MTRALLLQLWNEDDGVISFEWTMMVTLLVIGVVSGISAARDAIVDEFADVSEAAINWDQSYTLPATDIMDSDGNVVFSLTAQDFADDTAADNAAFVSCDRAGVIGQGAEVDDG